MRAGDRLGHFEILGPLGKGGMGQVWRARDARLQREVALKLLPAELAADRTAMARLRREAELMASVEHPNIAAIYSIEEHETGSGPIQFLVLELVPGRTLEQQLREGRLPVGEALAVGAGMARALAAAHERGVVHRDLKPANVILGPRGRVKVLDFGIAKTTGTLGSSIDPTELPTALGATATGALMGTAPYMSPEQVRGRPVDERTDLWGLACVLYEMLTGQWAFPGETAGDVLAAVVAEEPRWERLPAAVPAAVETLLRECLRKDPEQRAWTAGEARRVLEMAATTGPNPALPASGRRLSRRLAAAIALGVLGVAVGTMWVWGPFDGPRAPIDLSSVAAIVALPAALDGEPDPAYRATHEFLSTQLAGLPGILVKQPPSEVEIERLDGDMQRLSEQYRVDAFVVSTVSRGPRGVLLRVRLVDPRTRGLLWGREYTGDGGRPEALIHTAAREVREALRPGMGAQVSPVISSTHPEAQMQLEVGRAFSRRYNNGHQDPDHERARSALERALEIDPGLADAAVELALLAVYRLEAGDASALDDLGQWADLAVSLDRNSGPAWSVMAIRDLYHSGSLLSGLPAALKGSALDPTGAFSQFVVGNRLNQTTTADLVRPALEMAAQLDPLHLYVRSSMGGLLLNQGREPVHRVLPHLHYPLEMQPDNAMFAAFYALALARAGDEAGIAEAAKVVRANAARFDPSWFAAFDPYLRLREAALRRDTASLVREVDGLVALSTDLGVFLGQDIVLEAIAVLARAGYPDEAERLLATCLENPDLLMSWDIYTGRPDLEPLRGTPTMQRVIAAARTRLETAIPVIERARQAGELADYLVEPYLALRARLGLPTAGRAAA